ncbi:MAG: glutamate--tRNA ligase [Clostridia bacterium]|nr:glutamate--tRNA ligase [Clostridia bacterium]
MDKIIRTRFAPSPTGYMHIGNLRTALYSYFYAKGRGGQFILRIEDTDQNREVEGSSQLIIDTLHETGLIYDEGPDIGGPYAPYVQSQRKTGYLEYAKQLVAQGDAYYCFCDKERLESLTDENGARKYDKHCLSLSLEEVQRRLANGESYVIRQNIPDTHEANTYHDMVFGDITVDSCEMEDQILIKSDGMPTYNFANVIDDHLMNINCVMRGAEYLSSTPKYNLLYDAFKWERPVYIHLPSIMRDATHKLSKRNGAAGYGDLKAKGFLREAILNYIVLLGWSPKNDVEKMSFDEMLHAFNLEGISKSNAIFDEVKLRWLNGLYIKELPFEEFVEYATPWLDKSCCRGRFDYAYLCKLIQGRIDTLEDIIELVSFVDKFGDYDLELYTNKKQKTSPEVAKEILPKVLDFLTAQTDWSEQQLHDSVLAFVQQLGVKNGIVLWPLRVALSGLMSTPGGATELLYLFGKEESLRRIRYSIDLLNK